MSIPISEYAERRNALAEHMGDNAIAILPSAKLLTRNNDAEFPFRQDSDFYYLTGFNEPDAVLALIPGREHGEAVLFCRERDPTKEMWDGKILGPDRALEELGVDDAFPISDIDDILPGLIEGRDKVFYALGRDAQFDAQMMEWVNTIRS
ncbi:aminopeptidase P N-terminal domain-containing protein, partial [Oleiphilus sp. HI0067]